MSKMKNILITGGAGFIGSHLSLNLLKKGYKVSVIDNLSEQIHGPNPEATSALYQKIKNKVEFHKGCITDQLLMKELISSADAVVHLAAETGTGQSMYEIKRYNEINNTGTSILLDLLTNTEHKVKKVIVASSRAVYGEGKYMDSEGNVVFPEYRKLQDLKQGKYELIEETNGKELIALPTSEDSKIDPISFYGITKFFQEKAVLSVCQGLGIDVLAFRFQNVYGPGQSLSNPYTGILAVFSNLILQNKTINIFEDGLESRDFVFIDDVVNATILGLENSTITGKVFNVGTGKATKVKDIADLLMKFYGIEVPVRISGDFRLGDIRHNFADLSEIKANLDFHPTVDIHEGLEKFVNWVLRQPTLEDKNNYEKSLDEMRSKNLFFSN